MNAQEQAAALWGKPDRLRQFLRSAGAHARFGRFPDESRAAFAVRYAFQVLPSLAGYAVKA